MSINPNKIELEVEAGPERGRRYVIEPSGARIGRDPSNDFVVHDPSLSRFHCRIYLAGDGQARVADLGSTNTTEVNGSPIVDVALMPGDRISIGDTVLRILGTAPAPAAIISDTSAGAGAPPPLPATPVETITPAAAATVAPEVPDLFRENTAASDAVARKHISKTLWLIIGLLFVVVIVVALIKSGLFDINRRDATKGAVLAGLEIQYEKVEATSTNIFRYDLALMGSNLSARIDNLENARHTTKDKKLNAKATDPLISRLESTGFFGLDSEYVGQGLDSEYVGQAKDILDAKELTITMGSRTKRVRVVNRVQPESFVKACAIIEAFGQNELGLAALPLSPEKLIEMARDAMLQGKKYYDTKDVSFGNLYKSMKAFEEADNLLETIDPKPEFYKDIIGGRSDTKKELQQRYDDSAFRAEKSIKIQDWQDARKNLRIILESIPDRDDDRYKDAQVKLLDVERHLTPRR
ncbi:MAG: FHA domain-containing protein [Kiritimatiellaeota bacterium]|nr:FHA domain-containing protein [Kiritimatiellota bacterium]